jgi:hypothetical protein
MLSNSAVGEFARLLFCEGNEVAHAGRRKRRMPKQCLVDADDAGDRGEVLLLVVGKLALSVKRRIDREGPGLRHQQRIAVGRRLGHGLGAEHVGGAALVFDHDLLPPPFGEPLA